MRLVRPATTPTSARARRLLGRPRPDAVVAIAIGVGLALATILPAIGRPDELVDSPDAVYHLDRITTFLETGNFSIANPTFYPNGFHAWIATSLLPGVADVLPGTNVATRRAGRRSCGRSGCVALVRHALGTSRLVTYAAGFASAAFIAFPTILLGWGVLWPNLMATALTPGALALMLQAARSRRIGQWLGFAAAMPGLALIQPNALVALVLFALVWFVTARVRAGLLAPPPWWVVARDLAIVAVVGAAALVAAPVVSARAGLDPVLRVEGPGLDLDRARRGRRRPAADPRRAVGSRRAHRPRHRLDRAARPGRPAGRRHVGAPASCSTSWPPRRRVVDRPRHGLLVQRQGPARLARGRARRRPRRRGRARRARAAAQGARACGRSARRGRRSSRCSSSRCSRSGSTARTRNRMLTGFFRPSDPKKVILSFEAQDSLRRLAALIPAGQGVVGPPGERLAAHVAALRHQHALPLDPDPRRPATRSSSAPGSTTWRHRPDVCAAMARHDIRWAIDSTHVYWLDRPERSSGLTDLANVDGVEAVRTDGDYTLYRVTGCGLGGTPTS